MFARQLVHGKLKADDAAQLGKKMDDTLVHSVAAYRSAEEKVGAGAGCLNAYLVLNRLAVDLLTPWQAPELKDTAIGLAQRCRQSAAQAFAESPSVRDAAIQAEALLIERLLDGSFGAVGADARKSAGDEVATAYVDALSNLTVTPSEFESIVTQIELLARFFAAKCKCVVLVQEEDGLKRTAAQLSDLVARLQPTRAGDDSPVDEEADTGKRAPTRHQGSKGRKPEGP